MWKLSDDLQKQVKDEKEYGETETIGENEDVKTRNGQKKIDDDEKII